MYLLYTVVQFKSETGNGRKTAYIKAFAAVSCLFSKFIEMQAFENNLYFNLFVKQYLYIINNYFFKYVYNIY